MVDFVRRRVRRPRTVPARRPNPDQWELPPALEARLLQGQPVQDLVIQALRDAQEANPKNRAEFLAAFEASIERQVEEDSS